MKHLKAFFAKLAALWPWAKSALEKAAELALLVLPYIKIVADLTTAVTPTKADDAVWAAIKRELPRFFDGSLMTETEVKLYSLGVATELLKAQYPEISTSVARLAVQAGYTGEKKEG